MGRKLTDDKQGEILRTGITQFAKLGYDRANINPIAKKAGISVGVLYKYYGSKEEFFLSCVRKSLEALQAVLDPVRSAGEHPEELAEHLVRAAADFARDNREEMLLYHRITNWEKGEETRRLAREIEEESSRVYVRLMTDLARRGMLRQRVRPEYMAMFFDNLLMMLQFTGSLTYYDERWRIYCGEPDREELIRQMTSLMAGFFRESGPDAEQGE